MFTLYNSSIGGQIRAIQQRKDALSKYYQNPRICKNCQQVIRIPDGVKVSLFKNRIFCNNSCAAEYNNKNRDRKLKERICKECGDKISPGNNFCEDCKNSKRQSIKASLLSKGELFSQRHTWTNARATISYHARLVYRLNNLPRKCVVCGYDKHIQIAHLKSVSEFPDTALISEINAVSNLIGLCPNHHWEFDHGLLELK